MPRSTFRYPFEWKIHAWAQRFRNEAGFLAVFDDAGEILEVVEADGASFGNRVASHEIKDRVTQKSPSWIFYGPFDCPEYAYLSWQGVPRAVLERLSGEPFTAEDRCTLGQGDDELKDLPESWGVMF